MAKFTTEQAVAYVEIQQLINEWSYELDVHNGVNIGGLITEDCSYAVRGGERTGRAAVEQFYKERLATLGATADGVPTHRHMLANLRVTFDAANEASIGFSLVYFSTAGMKSGTKHADPALTSDVVMIVKRGADREWLIAKFDSAVSFLRVVA